MSLRYWFPFNNNFQNLGLDTCYIVDQGSEFMATSKFGHHSLHGHIDIISPRFAEIFNSQNFSISLWVKIIQIPLTTSAFTVYLFSCGASGQNTQLHYAVRAETGAMAFAFYGDDYTFLDNSTDLVETWIHVAFVYDGQKQIVYMNGRKVGERTTSGRPLTIAANSNFNLINNMAVVNDLRIYDHCLSAAEVKQLAKGLMLHYKLDNANPNIVSQVSTMVDSNQSNYYNRSWVFGSGGNGTSAILTDYNIPVGHKIYRIMNNTSGNKDYAQYSLPYFSLIENETYTMSCYCRGAATIQLRIWDKTTGQSLFTWTKQIQNTDEWIRYDTQFVATSQMIGNNHIGFLFGVTGKTTSANVDFCGFKVERGNKATTWQLSLLEDSSQAIAIDSSGQNNNGQISGNILYHTTNSGNYNNYKYSYYVKDATSFITLPYIEYLQMLKGSVSLWVNLHSNTNEEATYLMISNTFNFNEDTEFIVIGSKNGTSVVLDFNGSTVTYEPNINEWNLYTITWDFQHKNKVEWYINDQLVSTLTDTVNGSCNIFHDITRLGGAGHDYSLSDFRIYATALTLPDVEALYRTKFKIDNTNKLFSKSLQEVQSDIKLYKNGTICANTFIESNTNIKFKKSSTNDTSIQSLSYIEN